jgi:LPS-assembly protein
MLTSHPETTLITPRSSSQPHGLRRRGITCYGARLPFSLAKQPFSITTSNIKCDSCLEHFSSKLFFLIVTLALSLSLPCFSQNAARFPPKADLPPDTEIWEGGVTQDSQGEWKYLKGAAEVRTSEMTITADEIDFNQDTAWAYARGHVHLAHYASGDIVNADHAEYNIKTEEGKFFGVSGTSPAKTMTGVGVLTTTNPFFYQGEWADRLKNRVILHHGFVTDCKIPKPWWIFQAPVFDIVPGQHAIARHSVFRVKHVPVLYLPYYYRPLGKNVRQSGFLSPNFGHSTTKGFIYGGGYYWAINRSYDLDYILQYFSSRGPGHTFDIRGKPNAVSDFNASFYAVQDKGVPPGLVGAGPANTRGPSQGGVELQVTGRTQLLGFTGRIDLNYVSSFLFAAVFTNNFTPQRNSIGFLQRHFDHDIYALNIVFNRNQVFEDFSTASNEVVLQKLPSIEASSRLQQILQGKFPLWFSFNASSGLLSRRDEFVPTVFLQRTDVHPTVSSAFSFKGFSLYPSVSFEATDYGSQYSSNSISAATVAAQNLFRHDADFVLDFRLPSIERTYSPVKWLHLGNKVKHVIEAEAQYEYVTGVNQFQKTIQFDETDIISNTNQLTIGLTNRLYKKEANGDVHEILTWHLRQARYFDPTFGNTVIAGQSNVNLAQEMITPYTFIDGPRSYSPVISALTINPYPFLSLEYDAAYDPRHNKFVNHTVDVSIRHAKSFFTVGETAITPFSSGPTPANSNLTQFSSTNQLNFKAGYGSTNRQGFNVAAQVFYDLLYDRLTFSLYEASYNSNCCGFSFELRRVNNIVRDDNQYLFSFSVANIGSAGTLPRQNRIF